MQRSFLFPLFLAVALAATACGSPSDDDDASANAEDGPTWHQDIAPLFHAHCVHCHSEGNIGPFAFDDYDEAKVLSQWIGNNIRQRVMPPWSAVASDTCEPPHPFKHDVRLSQDEIDLIVDWGRRDAPEGDPATAAPLPAPIDRELEDATHRLDRGSTWDIGTADNGYFCFVLDPEFDVPHWLTAAQVVPDALDLLHHVFLYLVPPEQAAEVDDRLGPEGSFECFSSIADDGFQPLVMWLPDSPPLRLPEDSGVRAEPGSRLLMQVHYHAWRETGGLDQTAIDMKWTDEAPAREARFEVVGSNQPEAVVTDAPFSIPQELNQHVEELQTVVPADVPASRLWSVSGRLNHAGSGLELRSGSDCLLSVPEWNLDWMRLYQYDAPLEELPPLSGGDPLSVSCEYDNTWANFGLRDVLEAEGHDATFTMGLGPGELAEMCVGVLGLVDDVP